MRQRHALRGVAADAGEGAKHAVIETAAGLLDAEAEATARSASTWGGQLRLAGHSAGRSGGRCSTRPNAARPVAVNVGNPHAVFFVEDAERAPIELFGPVVERHPLFPERTNVEAAQVLAPTASGCACDGSGVGPHPPAAPGRARPPSPPEGAASPSAASPSHSMAAACASIGFATITC